MKLPEPNDWSVKKTKEYLWHYTCPSCWFWWTVATMDDRQPKIKYCPSCGEKCYHGKET